MSAFESLASPRFMLGAKGKSGHQQKKEGVVLLKILQHRDRPSPARFTKQWKEEGPDTPLKRRKYLQIKYLIRDLFPEAVKSSYNSTRKKDKPLNQKWAKTLNRPFPKHGLQNGQEAHEKMLNFISHQGNVNHNKTPTRMAGTKQTDNVKRY